MSNAVEDLAAEGVHHHLNWEALKDIIARDINICRQLIVELADSPQTVARQHAKIEALRNVQASMETVESYRPFGADLAVK